MPQAALGTPLSTTPSQSLSQPSQISGEGKAWLGRTLVPGVAPSSTAPLQLSSMPLQTSALGQCEGVPHLSWFSSTAPLQLLSTSSQVSPGLKHSHVDGVAP